jgi:hypothetical protein
LDGRVHDAAVFIEKRLSGFEKPLHAIFSPFLRCSNSIEEVLETAPCFHIYSSILVSLLGQISLLKNSNVQISIYLARGIAFLRLSAFRAEGKTCKFKPA